MIILGYSKSTLGVALLYYLRNHNGVVTLLEGMRLSSGEEHRLYWCQIDYLKFVPFYGIAALVSTLLLFLFELTWQLCMVSCRLLL